MSRLTRALLICAVAAGLGALCVRPRSAHAQNSGFQVYRYEPTAAGEWSFAVDHPWYSRTRYFAAGITLDYAHNPLLFGRAGADGSFTDTISVIEHQLVGHLDLAGSFLDRVLLTASLPVVFLERGNAVQGISPSESVNVGDPRFGVLVRLFGQPYASPVSLSIGGYIWVPLRKFTDSLPVQTSDQEVRGLPKLVLGGLSHSVLWSFSFGVLIRPQATIGASYEPDGRTAGSEIQLGAALAYASLRNRLSVGPELIFSTGLYGNARSYTTSLEGLVGLHYNIARLIQVGVAGGFGVLRQPGTPDARALLRVSYAPMAAPKEPARDRDHDGILDAADACPDVSGPRRADPEQTGCPDRDGDEVVDRDDLCPAEPRGAHPDPQRLGCPLGDRDGDGVLDPEDQCVDEAQGARPDPKKPGCPLKDRDGDGVLDSADACPEVPQGLVPDPARAGCPAGDRDGDTVPDPLDACPDQPGAPDRDAKKNGCPGLVSVKGGQLVIVKPVFFATNKDVILKKSFPVLQSVADALVASQQIKKVRVEGHTDNRGKPEKNLDLSARRARSVRTWLEAHGVAADRLTAEGYGQTRPIADNKREPGRAKNRRVDFVIIDPAQTEGASAPAAAPAGAAGEHHRHHHKDAGTEGAASPAAAPGEHHHRHHKDGGTEGAAPPAGASGAHHRHHHGGEGAAPADAGDARPHHRRHHDKK